MSTDSVCSLREVGVRFAYTLSSSDFTCETTVVMLLFGTQSNSYGLQSTSEKPFLFESVFFLQ